MTDPSTAAHLRGPIPRGLIVVLGATGILVGVAGVAAVSPRSSGLAASLALSVAQLAALIPTYQDSFTALVNDLRAWLGSLGVGPDQLQAVLSQINFANVAAVVANLLAGVAAIFSNLLFLLFVVAFMAIDATGFSRRLARAKPGSAEQPGRVILGWLIKSGGAGACWSRWSVQLFH